MPATATCPEAAKLAAHARCELVGASERVVDEHLAVCPHCRKSFGEVAQQSLAPHVPDCHVVKEIGRGRFGVVYKAWWLTDKPLLVALKILSYAGDMEKSRFDREIAVLKRIDSPGIVKCLHSGDSVEGKYYLMEFVDGVHLDDFLSTSTHGLTEKLAVFQRVCRAVADAHAHGVIHRDLKPRNILVDDEGRPHILDFGICSVDTSDWSSWARGTITSPGDVIGTLKYMSPEQAWGGVAGVIDERTDIWALGVMLYELITNGGYPYSVGSTPDKPAPEALLDRIRKELPRLPRLDLLPRGRDLEVLMERCLVWEADHRLSSAATLADDLERYCLAERIKTKPLSSLYRMKRLAVGTATRSRGIFYAVFLAALGMTLWLATLLFGVGWEVHGSRYVGGAGSAITSDAACENMVIAAVSDETVGAVVEFAAGHQMEDVTQSVSSWRGLHGLLMERLAEAQPLAVVWDYYFRTLQTNDALFVSGMNKLEDAGVPVILAAAAYDAQGNPDLSPGITASSRRFIRHGAIVARDMVRRPGEFVLAMKRDAKTVIPSMSLTTLAAMLHPESRLELDWSEDTGVTALYALTPRGYQRERDRIPLTKFFKAGEDDQAARSGDYLACTTFPLQPPEHWMDRTVPYESLLTGTPDRLYELAHRKVVIFGDTRSSRPGFAADRHPVKYDNSTVSDVPGCYLLADAIAGLLDRNYIKAAFPLSPVTFFSMLALGAVGCGLPIKLAAAGRWVESRMRRRWLQAALLSASAGCFLVLIESRSYVAIHAGMAGFSLLAPMTGAFWVEFTRNRYRLLENTSTRALENLGRRASGTVTLGAPLAKPQPETR